jgi:hypothetical protein
MYKASVLPAGQTPQYIVSEQYSIGTADERLAAATKTKCKMFLITFN